MTLLGCIADDFTGATDLASNLVSGGLRVVQTIGVPRRRVPDAQAIVIALKTRTGPAEEAIGRSLEALAWLQREGCRQFYFKVCSTFDSTTEGNIGPVAEAMLEALGETFCCVVPAFPDNERTVYQGHLFVDNQLLSESGMRHHPLTPMTDSNIVRVLQSQSRGKVGLVPYHVVKRGPQAVRKSAEKLRQEGCRFGIVDAIANDDLMVVGTSLSASTMVVGGSGIALGLARNFGIDASDHADKLPLATGSRAIVSGSCSEATIGQIRHFQTLGLPAFVINPARVAGNEDVVAEALAWSKPLLGKVPLLIYSSAPAESVRAAQKALGALDTGQLIENALAAIAKGLVDAGVGQLILAGGETSGAAVSVLGVEQMRIGPRIDAGVPWCHAFAPACGVHVHMALKSGNFGGEDFFTRSFEVLSS